MPIPQVLGSSVWTAGSRIDVRPKLSYWADKGLRWVYEGALDFAKEMCGRKMERCKSARPRECQYLSGLICLFAV